MDDFALLLNINNIKNINEFNNIINKYKIAILFCNKILEVNNKNLITISTSKTINKNEIIYKILKKFNINNVIDLNDENIKYFDFNNIRFSFLYKDIKFYSISKINLFIDLRTLQTQDSNRGIGIYIKNLINEFKKIIDFNIIGIIDKKYPFVNYNCDFQLNDINDINDIYHLNDINKYIFLWTNIMMPYIDMSFSLPQNSIAIVYDLIPYLHKDIYLNNYDKLKDYNSRLLLLKKMKYIITISYSVKNDIISNLNINENKIYVLYPSINYRIYNKTCCVYDINQKFNCKKGYILCIGGNEQRKNINNLINAFLKYLEINKDYKLIIVNNKKICENENIIFLNYVTDEELNELYNCAQFSIFPSKYEGFGLPIIESIICMCPVTCSNIEIFKEITNNNAIFFDCENIDDIYSCINYMINNRFENIEKTKTINKFIKNMNANINNKILEIIEKINE